MSQQRGRGSEFPAVSREMRKTVPNVSATGCVRLMGGLGNQLFQYAFGLRLKAGGRKVSFDTRNGFIHDAYVRSFALAPFVSDLAQAKVGEIPAGMSWPPPFHRLAKWIWSARRNPRRLVYYEKSPFGYEPEAVGSSQGHRYFHGYWQHPGYGSPVESDLREKLRLHKQSAALQAAMEEMAGGTSVSVHIRRYNDRDRTGRIVTNAQKSHGVCGADYFQRALDFIPRRSGLIAYLFTDEVEWCREHVHLDVPSRYVADMSSFSDAEELVLMASCRHHIISNSSFSWWGAWLGKHPETVVVAPEVWNRSITLDQSGVCPPTWLRL